MSWQWRVALSAVLRRLPQTWLLVVLTAIPLAVTTAVGTYDQTARYTPDEQRQMFMGAAGATVITHDPLLSLDDVQQKAEQLHRLAGSGTLRLYALGVSVDGRSEIGVAVQDLTSPLLDGMYGVLKGELTSDTVALTQPLADSLDVEIGKNITVGDAALTVGAIVGRHVPLHDHQIFIPPALWADLNLPVEAYTATWYIPEDAVDNDFIADATVAGFSVFTSEAATGEDEFPQPLSSAVVMPIFVIGIFLVGTVTFLQSSFLVTLDRRLRELGVQRGARLRIRVGTAVLPIGGAVVLGGGLGILASVIAIEIGQRAQGAFWATTRPAWGLFLAFAAGAVTVAALAGASSRPRKSASSARWTGGRTVRALPLGTRLAARELLTSPMRTLATFITVSALLMAVTGGSLVLNTAITSVRYQGWLPTVPDQLVRVDLPSELSERQLDVIATRVGAEGVRLDWLGVAVEDEGVLAVTLSTESINCVKDAFSAEASSVDLSVCQELAADHVPVQQVAAVTPRVLDLLGLEMDDDALAEFEKGTALCLGDCPDGPAELTTTDSTIANTRVNIKSIGSREAWALPSLFISSERVADLGLSTGADGPFSPSVPPLSASMGHPVSVLLAPRDVSSINTEAVAQAVADVTGDRALNVISEEADASALQLESILLQLTVVLLTILTIFLAVVFAGIALSHARRNEQLESLGFGFHARRATTCFTNLSIVLPAQIIGAGVGVLVAKGFLALADGARLQFSPTVPLLAAGVGVFLAVGIPYLVGDGPRAAADRRAAT